MIYKFGERDSPRIQAPAEVKVLLASLMMLSRRRASNKTYIPLVKDAFSLVGLDERMRYAGACESVKVQR